MESGCLPGPLVFMNQYRKVWSQRCFQKMGLVLGVGRGPTMAGAAIGSKKSVCVHVDLSDNRENICVTRIIIACR
jgi:hypothetical protein